MSNDLLSAFGFDARFSALAAQNPELLPARVISQERERYLAVSSEGELAAEISGKLRYEASSAEELPTVGDFVLLDRGTEGFAVIRALLSRKSVFLRRAAGRRSDAQAVAANIDTVFICMSLNENFNLHRLERYLSVAWDSGAVPVVVLTKADLADDAEKKLADAEGVAAGADVRLCSALEEDGCKELFPYIAPGKTVAFIGSSGVGKSTLINRLAGKQLLDTQEIRSDGKGRHTTTRRQLILLENGGMLIDTPGMRELGMWESADGISRAFEDVETLARRCRFADCTHSGEPGCAVREAIENGQLSPERLRSFQKLAAENACAEDAAGYLAAKKEKFKTISKLNKARNGR